MTLRKLLLVLMAVFFAGTLVAQENRASLGGRVTDSDQAIVPGATVTVTSMETKVALTVRTNGAGEWLVQNLLPAHYRFTVTDAGFSSVDHTPIELQVGDRKTIDTVLRPGGANEVVTVQSTTPLIDGTAASQGTVITTKELEELPSQTNVATLLAGLTPGVIVGSSTGTSGHLWSNISASALTVNGSGSGSRALNYQLDGATDSSSGGNVAFVPPIDAVQEFKVTDDAYDASISRQSAATISLQLKSGTQAFHGTLFEFNQNNSFNARQYTYATSNVPKPSVVHYNEYGGTVGGPVWIPKLYDGRKKGTFFFYSVDGIRNIAPGNAGYVSLPTTLEKKGDFSHSFTTTTSGSAAAGTLTTTIYPARLYDPTTYSAASGLRSEFAGNNCSVPSVTIQGAIPTGTDPNTYLQQRRCSITVNPIATAYFAHMPDVSPTANDGVNSDSNNFAKVEKYTDKMITHLARFDQTWSDRNRSYVSLRYNNWTELGYNTFGADATLQGLYQNRTNTGITLDHTYVFSPKLLADLRFNFTRFFGGSYNPSVGINPTSFGFSSTLASQQTTLALPQITGLISGAELGGLGTSQSSLGTDNVYEYIVNMTHTAGAHALRYGIQFLNQQNANSNLGAAGGTFAVDNSWTKSNPIGAAGAGEGSALGSFELALPSSGSIPTNTSNFYDQHYFGVYLQDDWRINPKLTLNLGLRWDVERPVEERYNRQWAYYNPNFVQTAITNAAQPTYAGLYNGPASNPGLAVIKQYGAAPSGFVAKGAYEYAGINGNPRTILNTRYKYFQPRIGFAYQFTTLTSLKGGLGRFVQSSYDEGVSAQQFGYSLSTYAVPTTDSFRTIAPGFSLANPFAGGLNAPVGNSLGELTYPGQVTGFRDRNYGRPYTDTASLEVQQQISNILVEIGGTLNITHGQSVYDPLTGSSGFQVNIPNAQTWFGEYSPTFSATGRPDDTLPGNLTVTNPFKGGPNFQTTQSQYTSSTVAVSQLVRPNPITGNIIDDRALGKNIYYAMNTKVERRYHNGFSVLQAFTWAKDISENSFTGPQGYAEVIERRLSSGDIKLHYTLTPIYTLPFGRGRAFLNHANRAVELAVGGWELTGIYNLQSGTPVVLPTNTAFFLAGQSPSAATQGRHGLWFDKTAFRAYPQKTTPNSTLAQYPSWTGVTGYKGYGYQPTSTTDAQNGIYQDFATRVTYNQTTFGDIRQPYANNFDLAVRKSLNFTHDKRLELRLDAYNAFNHPRFGGIGTDPNSLYFAMLGGTQNPLPVNNPRAVQISGKFFF